MQGLDAGIPKAKNDAEQICNSNRAAGPGGCLDPQPPIHFRLVGLWNLLSVGKNALIRAGMDAWPVAPDFLQFESLAKACGEPWDATTVERLERFVQAKLDVMPKPKK
jgi:hypothetical protein